jgi:MFS family permease
MEKGKIKLTVVLLLGMLIFGVPGLIGSPALLSMAHTFGLSREDMAPLFLGLFLSWVITPPLCAPLSNLLGKRNFLVLGALVATAGICLMGTAKTLTTAACANFIMGFGGMCFQIIGISALFDLYPKSRASAVTLSQTVGAVFTLVVPPLVSQLVSTPGGVPWQHIYFYAALLPLVVLIFVSTQHFPQAPSEQTNFRAVGKLFTLPFFWLMGISMLVYGIIEQGIPAWLPSYMGQDLKAVGIWAGLPLSLYGLSMTGGRLIAGAAKIADRVPYYTSIIVSTLLGMAVIGIGVATTNPILAGISLGMVGFVICLIWPAILSAAVDTTGKDTTTVMGGIIFFGGTGALLGSYFMGPLTTAMGSMRLALSTLEIPGLILLLIFLTLLIATRGKAKKA